MLRAVIEMPAQRAESAVWSISLVPAELRGLLAGGIA
jgi:hypothetical protein